LRLRVRVVAEQKLLQRHLAKFLALDRIKRRPQRKFLLGAGLRKASSATSVRSSARFNHPQKCLRAPVEQFAVLRRWLRPDRWRRPQADWRAELLASLAHAPGQSCCRASSLTCKARFKKRLPENLSGEVPRLQFALARAA
jgi:hypothetical protein